VKKIILISHGDLSKGMARSAQMIAGENANLSYYGLYPGQHPSEIIMMIKNEAINYKENDFIVIADILGGSVCNAAMELLELKNVKLLSGMNLSLVIEVLLEPSISDKKLNETISNAKEGIKLFSSPENIKSNEEENEFFQN
jgi:fructoselysine and glucoselysine-specific PTS system IIA component